MAFTPTVVSQMLKVTLLLLPCLKYKRVVVRVVAVLSGALMNTDLPLRHFPTEDQPLSLTGKASKSTNNVLICIDTQLYN